MSGIEGLEISEVFAHIGSAIMILFALGSGAVMLFIFGLSIYLFKKKSDSGGIGALLTPEEKT